MGAFVTTTSIDDKMLGTVFGATVNALATACIVDAENEVKKYVSKRYAVSGWTTTASTPPMIVTCGEWLAIGYIYEALARGGNESYSRADRYIKRAIANLTDLRDYKIDLFDSSGSLVSEITNNSMRVVSNTDDYSPTFNEDDPINWTVDADKLEDIADERDE